MAKTAHAEKIIRAHASATAFNNYVSVLFIAAVYSLG